ncbi:MAG TPA: hypothetical protein VMW85_05225 [Methanomassiliicoccales archaeon]|nr:hypothetical protein [Methanomassiliicoccales archaeon]
MGEVKFGTDHRSVFKVFLILLLIYMGLFIFRICAFQFFGIGGSYLTNGADTLIMFMMIPFVLFLLILWTMILALTRVYNETENVSLTRMILYTVCFFAVSIYGVWMFKVLMDSMTFT